MAYDQPLGRVGRALGRALKDWLRSGRPVLRMDDFDRQHRGLNQFAWIFLFWFLGGFAFLIIVNVLLPRHAGFLTILLVFVAMASVVKLVISLLFK